MKRNSYISIGPGAASLILILVVLCMSILGMLSLVTVRNDERFSDRSIQVAGEIYGLHAQAERMYADIADACSTARQGAADQESYMAALTGSLPGEAALSGDEISFSITGGERILTCAVRVLPLESEKTIEWITYTMAKEAEEIWDW